MIYVFGKPIICVKNDTPSLYAKNGLSRLASRPHQDWAIQALQAVYFSPVKFLWRIYVDVIVVVWIHEWIVSGFFSPFLFPAKTWMNRLVYLLFYSRQSEIMKMKKISALNDTHNFFCDFPGCKWTLPSIIMKSPHRKNVIYKVVRTTRGSSEKKKPSFINLNQIINSKVFPKPYAVSECVRAQNSFVPTITCYGFWIFIYLLLLLLLCT